MKNRIKDLRESMTDESGKKLSQAKFAEKLGISLSSVQKWEIGAAVPNNSAIELISERFGIREEWLRTGEGDMKPPPDRQEEMAALVGSLMEDSPESLRAALVTTLLRYPPDGPQWKLLERICDDVSAAMRPQDPKAPEK